MSDTQVERERVEEYIISAAEELNDVVYEKFTSGEIDWAELEKCYSKLDRWREALEEMNDRGQPQKSQ